MKLLKMLSIINEGTYPEWSGWYNPHKGIVVDLGPREIHRDALDRLGVTQQCQYLDLDDAFREGWVRVSIPLDSENRPSGVAHGSNPLSVRRGLDWLQRNHPTGGYAKKPWTSAWIAFGEKSGTLLPDEQAIHKFIQRGIIPRVFHESRDELNWGGRTYELLLDPTPRELMGAMSRYSNHYARCMIMEHPQEKKIPKIVAWDGHEITHHGMIEALRFEWGAFARVELEFTKDDPPFALQQGKKPWRKLGPIWCRGAGVMLQNTSLGSLLRVKA